MPLSGSLAPKTRALLAYVLVHAGDFVSRETIAAALWPDALDAEARKNLRRHLSLLTQYLPKSTVPWLEAEGRFLRWNPAGHARVDIWEFERLGASPVSRAAALDVYRDDLLSLSDEEWLEPLRERLRAQAVSWLCALFDAHEKYDLEAALRFGGRALALDPLREDVLRRMMALRAEAGDGAGALRDFGDFANRLERDLDARPAPETTALAARLRDAPNTVGRQRPASRAFATAFVGRENEANALTESLAEHRLVTIVGVGGLGKSRLGRHVAERIAERSGLAVHAFVVPPSASPSALVTIIADAFDLTVPGGEDALHSVADLIGERELVFVFDSCEHESDGVRHICETFLERCPGMRIIATSRIPLGASAEHLFRLGPLAFLERDEPSRDVLGSDAAALFLDRSRPFSDGSDLTGTERDALADICRRLGGIPLALELAAARRRVLGIVEIAERLGDRVDEQRTVRATIAWSYESLDVLERSLFRALCIFEAPFSIAAAEHVAWAIEAELPVVDTLSSLIDRSLVVVTSGTNETRYKILDPIREFGHEMLAASADAATVYESACAYFIELCDRHGLPEGEPEPRRAFEAIAAEHLNIRGILMRAVDFADRIVCPVELVTRMSLFWQLQGHVTDAKVCVAALLAVSWTLDAPLTNRCELALEASTFTRLDGELEAARNWTSEAREIARRLDREDLSAEADFADAVLHYTTSPAVIAREHFERCAGAFLKIGDLGRFGRCRANVANLHVHEAKHDAAADAMREAIESLRRSGRRRWLATAIGAMGYIERYRKNLNEAASFSREAFIEGERTGDRVLTSNALANLAFVAVAHGDSRNAVHYLTAGFEAASQSKLIYCVLSMLESSARLFIDLNHFEDAAIAIGIFSAFVERYGVVRAVEDRDSAATLEATITENLSDLAVLNYKISSYDVSFVTATRMMLHLIRKLLTVTPATKIF